MEGDRGILGRIVLSYVAFSALWIVVSDWLAEHLSGSRGQLSQFQSFKGLAFVAASAAVVFLLLRRELGARRAAELRSREQEARNRELAAARDRAEAADRLKSAFLATMSHELRTPLNSVIGFTGILLQEIPGSLNAEQRKQLGMVSGSARHLLALINDVLDLSKIEAGQFELETAPFDARASIESVVASMRPGALEKGLEVRLVLPAELGQILGDRRRFEQILLNLVGNAIKFTDRGRVSIEARLRPAGGVEVSVQDTGIGISAEGQEQLFRPFHQVENGTTRGYEGTGLGLSISLRLAGLMGGTIRVSSEPGQGSTFVLSLPEREPGEDAS